MALNASQAYPAIGYALYWGTKKIQVAEVVGPTSYATGGQTITALQFGWGGFDWFDAGGLSYSGTYYGRVQYLPVIANPSTLNPGLSSVKLQWIVAATNAEVANATNISGEVMRIFAIGV